MHPNIREKKKTETLFVASEDEPSDNPGGEKEKKKTTIERAGKTCCTRTDLWDNEDICPVLEKISVINKVSFTCLLYLTTDKCWNEMKTALE